MATVYKRGEIWWARYFNAQGKRVSVSTGKTRKRDAETEATRLEVESKSNVGSNPGLPKAYAVIIETAAREAAAGELTLARAEDLVMRLHRLSNPSFQIVSLSDHLSKWVRDHEPNVTASTAGVYWDMHRRITEHVGKRAASSPVGDLTADQVRNALQKAKDTGLRASTVNMDLAALRRALHAAVTAGLAKANVAVGIKPMPEDDSTERAPFTPEEVRAMMDHPKTSKEWKGAILLAAHTGLRLSDVTKLSRGHVDGTRLVIRPKKSKRSKKTISIPLSPPCIAWIGDRQGLFFPTLSKRVAGTLSTTFTRIMASTGVDRDIELPGGIMARRSFHCLRHSFTSWLAEADVHADIRQKLTGHSSSKIHQIYTHHDESLDRAVAMLPDL
jgi:integrase